MVLERFLLISNKRIAIQYIHYKYPYDLHNYTAFEDTEVRFLKSLLLLQLNNHKKGKERKEKIK